MRVRPKLAITMGDPLGIGPEVTVKALADLSEKECVPVVIGDGMVLKDALEYCRLSLPLRRIESPLEASGKLGVIEYIEPVSLPREDYRYGQVSASAGESAFQYVTAAIGYAMKREVDGVVTGPINKEAIHLAGHPYSGHTEIFSDYTHTKQYAMLLMSGHLRVIHCTTHVSMRQACDLITTDRVYHVIELADQAMKMLGLERYRIGVAGLNAHCSENGLFGTEEEQAIIPAIKLARSKGICVEGPVPPDTVFVKAVGGQYDVVVAMYHDQGHIPLKLMGFRMDAQSGTFASVSGINTTIGLPILRTSVDHGTAFDRAGKNMANEQSMLEAIRLAVQMAPFYRE
ncbi:MAG: 4-hydroxythreonine-4-phosphate dehydrogenase PdxA [Clostridia bacterium]|nr:4-hydroxythreonine-4-phosphate dehydrogenase PdxA [Clostridia bacterium]